MPYMVFSGNKSLVRIVDDPYWQDEWGSGSAALSPYFEGRPVDPKYLPSSGYVDSNFEALAPFVHLPTWLCTQEVREVIESVEPGIHRFFPYPVRRSKVRKEVVQTYFTINFCNSLEVFDPEGTDPHLFKKVWSRPVEWGEAFVLNGTGIKVNLAANEPIRISACSELMRAHHAVIDPRLSFSNLFISDAMHDALWSYIENKVLKAIKTH